jgi:hypothetical protein
MTRDYRRYRIAFVVVVTLLLFGTPAIANTDLPQLWSVSDDTLSTPFGIIVDVAVGENNDVYLLDSQNMLIRRISVDGVELSALGGAGEGPGEFRYPIKLAINVDGGCTVFQDFYQPAVCVLSSGAACIAPDLSEIKDRFDTSTIIDVRSDRSGRLLLSVITTDIPLENVSSSGYLQPDHSLFALQHGETSLKVLFSDRIDLCDKNTVRLNKDNPAWLDRYWDVNRDGRIVYADPSGAYRVVIGHPADGESVFIDLLEEDTDTDNLKRLADTVGLLRESLSRIAAVHWVGDERFLVKPMACIPGPTTSRAGTFELIDTAGNSYGREKLNIDYDPDYDELFIRHGILVVIKGGKAAVRADLSQKAALIGKQIKQPTSAPPEYDGIRVDAYSLMSHYSSH